MFVIVRHGNTFTAEETPRRIGARTDLPLTDKGLNQAAALGHLFAERDWQFRRVLVSPLLRTRQTAEAILTQQVSPPNFEMAEFLREIDHGPDENRTEEEVLARIGPTALADWDARAVPPTGWMVEQEQRIAAWRSLFEGHPHDSSATLLVTSNGAARFALMALPSLQAAAHNLPSLKLPTGGYGVIRQGQKGEWEVPAWGECP